MQKLAINKSATESYAGVGYSVIPRPNNALHAVFLTGKSGRHYQILIPMQRLVSLEKVKELVGELSLSADYRITNHCYAYSVSRAYPILNPEGCQTIIDLSVFQEDMVNLRDNNFSKPGMDTLWCSPDKLKCYFGDYLKGDITSSLNHESSLVSGTFKKRRCLINESGFKFSDKTYDILPITAGVKDELEILIDSDFSQDDIQSLCEKSITFYCNAVKFSQIKGDSKLEAVREPLTPSRLSRCFSLEELNEMLLWMSQASVIDCNEQAFFTTRHEKMVHYLYTIIEMMSDCDSFTGLSEDYLDEMRLASRLYNFSDLALFSCLEFSDFNRFTDYMSVNQHQHIASIIRSLFGVDSDILNVTFGRELGLSPDICRVITDMASSSLFEAKRSEHTESDHPAMQLQPSVVVKVLAHLLHSKGVVHDGAACQNPAMVKHILSMIDKSSVLIGLVDKILAEDSKNRFHSIDVSNSPYFDEAVSMNGRISEIHLY